MWLPLGIFNLVVVGITGQSPGEIIEVNPEKFLPEHPSVVISQGTVLGSLSNDGTYAEFYGIPYADATSGSNRFKVNSSKGKTYLCFFFQFYITI